MSSAFRTSRFSRTYWPRAEEAIASNNTPLLAPDITTERDFPAPSLPAAAAAPAQPPRQEPHSILETRHPEISKAISLLWGFPEMNDYFDRIWMADGGHGPIDPDAMSELMFLSRLHQTIVPSRPGRSLAAIYGNNRLYDSSRLGSDPWSSVPPRR